MATLVKLKNAIIKTLQGAPGKSVNSDIEGLGKSIDDAEIYHTPGILSRPQDDTQGVMFSVNNLNIIIATHDYKIDKSLDKGEVIIYSVDDSGTILSSIYLNDDSEVVINEGTDYAVAFEDLKTAFDQLKTDFDNHIHAAGTLLDSTGAPCSGSVATTTASTADIDPAKVEKVRLP